jgi:hypothetical protein
MIALTGPDKNYTLTPSLELIAALEGEYGSLYLLADDLLEKSLPLSEMVEIVKALYRHAGCTGEIDGFLLQQPCTEILISFLLEVLGPIERVAVAAHLSRPFLDDMMKKFPDTQER